MPSFAPITLTDRDLTAHVFSPRMEEANNVYRFAKDDPSGVILGETALRVSLKETPSSVKVRLKLERPTLVTETVNGVNRSIVERRSMADLTFTFARTSTSAERREMVGMISDALTAAQTDLDAMIVDLKPYY